MTTATRRNVIFLKINETAKHLYDRENDIGL